MADDSGKYIVLIVIVVALFGLLSLFVDTSNNLVGQGYVKLAQKEYTPGASNILDDAADPGEPPGYTASDSRHVLPGELAYQKRIIGGVGSDTLVEVRNGIKIIPGDRFSENKIYDSVVKDY